eukprot:1305950-Pleurochrysis_carterae.AAC.1
MFSHKEQFIAVLWNVKFGVVFQTFNPAKMGASLLHVGESVPSELEANCAELFGDDPKEGSKAFENWREEFVIALDSKAKWAADMFSEKAFSSRHVSAHMKRLKIRFYHVSGENDEQAKASVGDTSTVHRYGHGATSVLR